MTPSPRCGRLAASSRGAGNIDTITDFLGGSDLLRLDDAIFVGLALGSRSAAAFSNSGAATTADHRIIYDAGTDALSYDADGNGAGAAVQFATLSGAPAISHIDFIIT